MVKYPYGKNEPFALVELVASTSMHSTKYKTDQMPVLAARVSHAGSGKTGDKPSNDVKLMEFLAEHRHNTPFEHQSATFRVVCPLFVVREWQRHRTQSYNEISMRYSSDIVGKTYIPEHFRSQATRDKQSSAGNITGKNSVKAYSELCKAYNQSLKSYNNLLDLGVCREQARMVVPVGNYTEMYVTASLRNWHAFWLLRSDKHAQWEIRQYSDSIASILKNIWPDSWSVLENSN